MKKFNPPSQQTKSNNVQPSTSTTIFQVSMKANQTNQTPTNRTPPTETLHVSQTPYPERNENTETLPRPLRDLPRPELAASHQVGAGQVTHGQGRDKRGRFEKTGGAKEITEEQKIENAKSSRVTKIKGSIVEQMKTIQSIR